MRLTRDIIEAAAGAPRFVLGITGPPAAGKTTIARGAVTDLATLFGDDAVGYVPMDGFHLATDVCRRLGRAGRRGAPDTFDVDGFIALLRRVRHPGRTIYAPDFDHIHAHPVAAALIIPAAARFVVVEGNYLALDGDWQSVRDLIDTVWFIDAPDPLRRRRLLERHVAAGRTPEDALAWIQTVDDPNAQLIRATIHRCDVVIDGGD